MPGLEKEKQYRDKVLSSKIPDQSEDSDIEETANILTKKAKDNDRMPIISGAYNPRHAEYR